MASVLVTISPVLSSILIFDKNSPLVGYFWRILTCHLVHFSPTHLAYNVFTFGIGGYLIEKENYPHFGLLLLWLSLFISISLFTLKPDMNYYGGLSGIACGTLYYCALMGLKESRPWQTVCLLMLLFLPIKIAVEIYKNSSILPYQEHQLFIPMQTSHIVGCLGAVLFYHCSKKKNYLPIPPSLR